MIIDYRIVWLLIETILKFRYRTQIAGLVIV